MLGLGVGIFYFFYRVLPVSPVPSAGSPVSGSLLHQLPTSTKNIDTAVGFVVIRRPETAVLLDSWLSARPIYCIILALWYFSFSQIRGHQADSSPSSPLWCVLSSRIARRLLPILPSSTRNDLAIIIPTLLGALSILIPLAYLVFVNILKSPTHVRFGLQNQRY